MNFRMLEERISSLARELQDLILLQLIHLYLHTGKVFLTDDCRIAKRDRRSNTATQPINFGRLDCKRLKSITKDDAKYRNPDLSIFQAMTSKRSSNAARRVFYGENTWVIPSGMLQVPCYARFLTPLRSKFIKKLELRLETVSLLPDRSRRLSLPNLL